MKFTDNVRRIAAISLIAVFSIVGFSLAPMAHAPVSAQVGVNTSAYSNSRYPPMVFTATSQTVKTPVGALSTATLEIYGPATACTLQVKVSNDGGTNYFATPYFAGVYASSVPTIVTGAAFPAYTGTPVLYWISLAGITNVEVISSGTFTGTSCSVQLTGSPNKFLP